MQYYKVDTQKGKKNKSSLLMLIHVTGTDDVCYKLEKIFNYMFIIHTL